MQKGHDQKSAKTITICSISILATFSLLFEQRTRLVLSENICISNLVSLISVASFFNNPEFSDLKQWWHLFCWRMCSLDRPQWGKLISVLSEAQRLRAGILRGSLTHSHAWYLKLLNRWSCHQKAQYGFFTLWQQRYKSISEKKDNNVEVVLSFMAYPQMS